MSFSFQVTSGDLQFSGDQLGIVYGVDKLYQDLMLWFSERYGIDRFHPRMGSALPNYIGGVTNYGTQNLVTSEALRILANYQALQTKAFKANPQTFSLSELLTAVNNVDVVVSYDVVSVTTTVTNGDSQTTTVTATAST
jgi:hypothetical protein